MFIYVLLQTFHLGHNCDLKATVWYLPCLSYRKIVLCITERLDYVRHMYDDVFSLLLMLQVVG